NGDLVFHNFANRLTVSGRLVTCEILDFFSKWRSPQEAIKRFAEYTPGTVRSGLNQLRREGLLLAKHSPAAAQDSRLARVWSPWLPVGSFHFSTKDVRYIRGNWSARQLKAILPKTDPPKIFKNVRGAKKRLPSLHGVPQSEFIQVLNARKTH